jgi:hypothetical protein
MDYFPCPHCGKNVNEAPKVRSTGPLSANHHLNGHIAQLCRETKNDWEDVKLGVKARAIKRGFPEPKMRRAGGRKYEVWKSEADCTPAECSMLIDEAHQIADELGIKLREE